MTGFTGSAPEGVSLPWQRSPMACGSRLFTRSPVRAPRGFYPGGFCAGCDTKLGSNHWLGGFQLRLLSEERSISASRSITSSSRLVEQGSNCPPCEDDGGSVHRFCRCRIDWALSMKVGAHRAAAPLAYMLDRAAFMRGSAPRSNLQRAGVLLAPTGLNGVNPRFAVRGRTSNLVCALRCLASGLA